MEELKSHPDRSLQRHVQDVRDAASAILARHSSDAETKRVVEDIVSLHDLGKATREFQRYIRDPAGFKGDRDRKAHTPLGFTAALLLGENLGWPPFRILCVAAAVLGHHTRFPTANRITDTYLMNDRWAGIIEDQASGLPLDAASEVTGFDLREVLGDPDICDEANDVAEELVEALEKTAKGDLPGAVADRLRAQFVFSVLLEADKAFLALSEEGKSRYRLGRDLALRAALIEEYLNRPEPSEINELRTRARRQALENLEADPEHRLWTLTLPTGLGKTLTAASLAFELREMLPAPKRRVFIVLPFLSIIDQTAKVYDELLGGPATSTLMQSHSLSERAYDEAEGRDAEFLLDTWDSEIVITTFDQFLLSLLGDRSRHQMRFHNLADAIVVFDEVQTLPAKMWDLLNHSVAQLTETLNSHAIIMSATQPGFITGARELVNPPQTYYEKFKRYRLVLKHKQPMRLEDFVEETRSRREELERFRVLVTLNTRSSAREVRDALADGWNAPAHFLTADVTPKDRLAAIREIKEFKDEPCLVVSTQVIEAGVDIDMDLVMRDFAPLDSLIQVAGRCNRNGGNPRRDVEIYRLVNDKDRPFAEMVYTVERGSPDVRLEITRQTLDKHDSIPEEEILDICNEYFSEIRIGKDLGRSHTVNWATLADEQPDIRTLLRGERNRQVQLIVAERDEGDLVADIEEALAIPDRWERRSALRRLAGRISRVTVSVWVRQGWHPGDVANPIGNYDSGKEFWKHPWWIVRPGNYYPKTGINVKGDPFL
ncbi:MAG: CRISPR-associated helicase Cas3' [Rubrobacteraceae bacterium]